MRSIRQQLRYSLVGGTLIFSLVAAAALYGQAADEADEQSDLLLRHIAAAFPAQLTTPAALAPEELEDDVVMQAWRPDGTLLYSTRPALPLGLQAGIGYKSVTVDHQTWRVYDEVGPDRIVQVAQPLRVRQEVAANLALRIMLPFVILLAVLAALIFVMVGRALRPLDALARAVAGSSAHALAPVDLQDPPPELVPIIASINGLLDRIDHVMTVQRNFIADAAHELRSPLTALKLQLQLAERASAEPQRLSAYAKLHARLDRAAHLVNQLLTLALNEPGREGQPFKRVDLWQLARNTVADQSAVAQARAIDLGVAERNAPVHLSGDADALAVLMNNLVDNALRYTQPGGKVDVSVEHDKGRALLRVIDNGPGVPQEAMARLFDRFYRIEGSGVPGCGLGLAIVKNIAERHGATVSLAAPAAGPGLVVTVAFPVS